MMRDTNAPRPPPLRRGQDDRAAVRVPSPAHAPQEKASDASAKQRKQRRPRSLLLLLKSFVGLRVRIDLKNDSVVEGVVEEVVHDMECVIAINVCHVSSL